jgi:TolB-like protein/Tfp pilus assembly protein PilF
MTLIEELKRRNVFKVAAAYAAVAWMFLELSALALNAFSAPAWVMKVIIFLVVAGFAVAVLMAWAFELTPEGIKRTSELEQEPSPPRERSGKLTSITISALALALVLVVVDSYVLQDAPAVAVDDAVVAQAETLPVSAAAPLAQPDIDAGAEEKSLVVLPFANLSDDPDQEYFSDGMTEELINTLSRVDDLLVTGRTSAFFYKNSALPLMEIGEALNVNHVLQGSVRKSGTQLRIAVTLTEASSGFNLWSDSYDRELNDIFAIQDEIAAAVTEALSVTLGAGAFDQPGMTRNVAAYDEWLKAAAKRNQYTPQSALEAIDHMEKAVQLDPDAARGWLRLRSAYGNAIDLLPPGQSQGFQQNVEAAGTRAISLAPDMLEVQLIAASRLRNEGQWIESDRVYQRLLDEHGNSQWEVNLAYGAHLRLAGRLQDSLLYLQRARRQEPLEPQISSNLTETLGAMPQYEAAAREEIARGLAQGWLVPQHNAELAWLEIQNKNWDAARAATQNMVSTRAVQLAAIDLLEQGRSEEGLATVRELLAAGDLVPLMRHRQMTAFAVLFGDPELALSVFREDGQPFGIWKPLFAEMRKLPGFKQLMVDTGLVDYWRSTGNWADYCRPVNDDFECF